MVVGYGALELHLPGARDLKSKRRIVRGLVDRLHARYRVSVAETGYHDLLQRSEIGVAVVASDASEVERILTAVIHIVESSGEAIVLDWDPELREGRE
jgi:uncharacterized protein YlxP (DUF503 family)